jgi:hypothetical protein
VRLRRHRRLSPGRGTLVLGGLAGAAVAGVVVGEVGRVWRRGSAPLPQETDHLLAAAEEARRLRADRSLRSLETAEVARAG